MWEAIFNDYFIYLLVFVRMSGMILFNPLFARRNTPTQIKMGLVLALTLIIAPTQLDQPTIFDGFRLIEAMSRELFVGFCCGTVFQIFYYMIFFAGDIIDTQFGLSMAKVFDPNTNIQMSVTGNWFSIIFIVYIFLTDSHLLMIKIFAASYDIIPFAAKEIIFTAAAEFMMQLFADVFVLCIRLALPFIAMEFILEVCMGILMKLIPQIHVFVINIQFKLLLGLVLLLLLAPPVTGFLENYMDLMYRNMERVMLTMR